MRTRPVFALGFMLLACLGAIACAGAGGQGEADPPWHYSGVHRSSTETGLFRVTLMVEDVDLNVGMNSFDILILDRDGNEVAGADVAITPWMPGMGHGVESKALVSYQGAGVYRVDDLEANMPGRWEFRVQIRTENAEDSVTFVFPSIPIE